MYAGKKQLQLLLVHTVLLTLGGRGSRAAEDYVEDETARQRLVNIYSLDGRCNATSARCSGFHYADAQDVAFFNLQTEVRIAPDGATYQLGGEQHLHTLTFENSTFVNFPLHLFYALELSELDMRNCSMEHVGWESFLMANKLVVLLLSDNKIRRLNNNTFNYASQLQFLFLNDNGMRELEANSFKGLQRLRHLDLSNNRLRELPMGLFDDLEALQHVNLAENRLRAIANELFAHNAQLLTVTLHTNRLRELGEYAFRTPMQQQQQQLEAEANGEGAAGAQQTHQLINVDLSHNQQLTVLVLNLNAGYLWARNCSLYRVNVYGSLTNVDLSDNRLLELYFSAPESLQRLRLSNNALVQLATLTRVPRLRHLDISDNPGLQELPMDWQTPALEQLDISNTSHTRMPLRALEGMPNLRKLNISANNMTEIEPQAFEQLSQLTHFFIHANDWNCYNLNLIMDLLMKPHGITYTVDAFDPNFPGQYINGIACMYRMDADEDESTTPQSLASGESLQKLSLNPDDTEVEKLRRELKSVVQFYDAKFDRVFEQLNKMNLKVKEFDLFNRTFWNQVTVTV